MIDCIHKRCALWTNGKCSSENDIMCDSIPPQFDEDYNFYHNEENNKEYND